MSSSREANVAFHYKNFLGYRKGEDGTPEIVPEEAETIRYIYERFLAGDSHHTIMKKLQERGIRTPSGKEIWTYGTLHSILTNEKYMGDAIINKTFTVDCISKKKKRNDGERAKYYVENNHPAIIDRVTFGMVQEELARRSGLQKVKQVGKASWHKNGVGKVFIKIRSHRTPSLRRMRNALSKVYMDISREKTDSMEMYQPAGLWKEILSQLTDNR